MTDNEIIKALEDNEIVEALECCLSDNPPCYRCKYDGDTTTVDECMGKLMKDTLDLINRQKAEIERLTNIVDDGAEVCHNCHSKYAEKIKQVKAEAVKEVVNRLQKLIISQLGCSTMEKKEAYYFCLDVIDNIEKEMAGDN